MEEDISRLPPGSLGLLVFPGLTGERSPYWKSFLTGSIVGLTLDHTPAHIFRAAMEGSSFRTARLLRALKENRVEPGIPIEDIVGELKQAVMRYLNLQE